MPLAKQQCVKMEIASSNSQLAKIKDYAITCFAIESGKTRKTSAAMGSNQISTGATILARFAGTLIQI